MGHWTVEVDKEGKVTVEGHEFKGSACELPKGVLEALGAASVQRKPEFFQREERKVAAGRRA